MLLDSPWMVLFKVQIDYFVLAFDNTENDN